MSARKRAESHKSGYESTSLKLPKDVKIFKLNKEEIKRVDVIPYRVGASNPAVADGIVSEGELYFERTFWVHRGIGPNQDTYVCPKETAKQRCPICEMQKKMALDPDADEDAVKALYPKERQLWNVIDLDHVDEGVQLWDISYHLFGKLLDKAVKEADEDEDFEFYPDLENGKTLKLGVTEKSFDKRAYFEVETIGFKNRKTGYEASIVDEAYNLDDLIQILPYDKLKAIMLMAEVNEDDEEEDERPARKPKKRPAPVEDDDDDEEEDTDDAEEEEEDRPRKSRKNPKGAKASSKAKVLTAEEAGLEEGFCVDHPEYGRCDIIRISGDGTSLTLEDEDGDQFPAIGCDEVTLVKKPKVSKSKTKAKVEDDDDDDDEDERPRKKSSKKPVKKPVEDDDDDDDDEDDEDDDD